MALPGIIIFVGAPMSADINWTSDILLNAFEPRFQHFLDGFPLTNAPSLIKLSLESTVYPNWRYLSLEHEDLRTGLSQLHEWNYPRPTEETSFLSQADLCSQLNHVDHSKLPESSSFLSVSEPSQNSQAQSISLPGPHNNKKHSNNLPSSNSQHITNQFYEESFALYAGIASSQLPPEEAPTNSLNTTITTSSTTSTQPISPSPSHPPAAPSPPSLSGHLSDLEDIPPAPYLQKIQPQTMTVNLIVGIISISSPRQILTRRGQTTTLIELLCGDDTKSGFTITFWLSQSHGQTTHSTPLDAVLKTLRIQDVIGVRNVALSSFRGKVYGQSLRKGMTRVHLLYRRRLDARDVGGCYGEGDLNLGKEAQAIGNPQVEKTRKVTDWVVRFVGAEGMGKRKIEEDVGRVGDRDAGPRKSSRRRVLKEVLPPDTQ